MEINRESRIVRNTMRIGGKYRVQFGYWIYPNRLHDGSPSKRFVVEHETFAANLTEAKELLRKQASEES